MKETRGPLHDLIISNIRAITDYVIADALMTATKVIENNADECKGNSYRATDLENGFMNFHDKIVKLKKDLDMDHERDVIEFMYMGAQLAVRAQELLAIYEKRHEKHTRSI